MRHISEVMNGLLARLYMPLDKTDNPESFNLTECNLSVKVCSKAADQEQELNTSYDEYTKGF